MAKPRIGIFSGSFDPVHDGHLAFASKAIDKCQLDKVFFMVEPRPRRRQGVKAFEHRNYMVELAINHEPKMGNIVLKQQRFTVSGTLPILKARFKGAQLYMLMGDDFFVHLASWPHIRTLADEIQLIIGARKWPVSDTKKQLLAIQTIKGLKFHSTVFASPQSSRSSTEIRLRLKKGHKPAGLNPQVLAYITTNGLYVSKTVS